MKIEISAGGVISRQIKSGWQILVIKDMAGNWTFPKGIIEPGESPEEAAQREIAEEVGLARLSLMVALAKIQYVYRRNSLVSKTVHYFLFLCTTRQRPTPQKSEGISVAKWVSLQSAKKIIGYAKTNLPLLEKTEKLLTAQ